DIVVLGERIVETAFRQAAIDGHLPAFEPVHRNARPRLLPLDAATAGLAEAGANAPPHPLARLACALAVAQLIEFHPEVSCRQFRPRRRCARDALPCRSCRARPECLPAPDGGATC